MVAADGGDVVAAGFGAGDAAVVVVVVEVQGMAFGLGGCVLVGLGGWGGGFCGGGWGFFCGGDDLHGEGGAGGEDGEGGLGFAGVHGEAVAALDGDDAVDEPATVEVGEPFGDVFGDFLVAVELGGGEGEVEGVAGEGEAGEDVGGAEAAVVGFAAGDDVFDVDIVGPGEGLAGVGAVEGAAGFGYDLGFEALGVAVVVGVVGCAAVFGLDGDAGEPVLGRGCGFEGGEALGEVVLGGEEAVDALGEVFEGEGALGVEAGCGEEEGDG